MSTVKPGEFLRRLGESGDGPHDIATAALMLSALDHPGRPLEPYLQHLQEIAMRARDAAQLASGLSDVVAKLAELLARQYGYDGDRLSYDDVRNADLIHVIDRKRGMPVALGILYLHAARAAGCEATGLNTPGHFLLRMSLGGRDALVDPFNGGAALERETLRRPPRANVALSEDTAAAEPVSDVDVLLRLQNNLKIRALDSGDRTRALEIARRMALFAPTRAEVWYDLARLHEAAEALGAAREAYESCLGIAKTGQPLHNEAALALASLKRRLN
jgi:regulator of sirC expression with transglutaminase-like and TPR domain